MTAAPIVPITPAVVMPLTTPLTTPPIAAAPPAVSFAQMLENGLDKASQNALKADSMMRAFILDDSVPVHQVAFALDQARASLALALQVRTRLLEGYQQFMNMQL